MATVRKISSHEQLIKNTVIRTLPDEVIFSKMFKDILLDEKHIIITDNSDFPRILIDLHKAREQIFDFKLGEWSHEDGNTEAIEAQNYVNKMLSYDG